MPISDLSVADDGCVHDGFPPELLLEGYPEEMRTVAERLRVVMRRALPGVMERVRVGWRIIGYDAPVGRRTAYFAWIMPQVEHVHLGFVYGALMDDPARLMDGAGVTVHARWLTFLPGDPMDDDILHRLIREGARVAALSRSERFAILLDRDPRDHDAGDRGAGVRD